MLSTDAMFNVQVKNAFKVFDLCRHKWYLLQCHTAIEKQQWLEAVQLERQRVRSDAENGFNLPDFRSKVAFLHHRQQVCAAGGKLGETSLSGGRVILGTVEWWDGCWFHMQKFSSVEV